MLPFHKEFLPCFLLFSRYSGLVPDLLFSRSFLQDEHYKNPEFESLSANRSRLFKKPDELLSYEAGVPWSWGYGPKDTPCLRGEWKNRVPRGNLPTSSTMGFATNPAHTAEAAALHSAEVLQTIRFQTQQSGSMNQNFF